MASSCSDLATRFRQSAFGLLGLVLGLGFLLCPAPARADCSSYCQGDYWACIEAYDSSTCGTQRSICVQRCISTGEGADNFGAIAYSSASDEFGFSYGFHSQAAAQDRAISECRKVGGKADCEIVVWFKNVCGALATDGKGVYGADWGPTTKKAEAKAMAYCKQNTQEACEVRKSVCSQ